MPMYVHLCVCSNTANAPLNLTGGNRRVIVEECSSLSSSQFASKTNAEHTAAAIPKNKPRKARNYFAAV